MQIKLKLIILIYYICFVNIYGASLTYTELIKKNNNNINKKVSNNQKIHKVDTQENRSTLYIKYKNNDIEGQGITYYVDATKGRDNNNGLSQSNAWKSLMKVNSMVFNPGDHILFKSSERWIGKLQILNSGVAKNPIIYGAYGGTEPPLITTFYQKDLKWEEESFNIWKAKTSEPHSQRIALENRELLYAVKKDELGSKIPDLVEWYQDNKFLYLFSSINPSQKIIYLNQDQNTLIIIANYITIQDIEFEGSTQGSIKIYNSSNIILQNIKAGKYSKSAVQVMGSKNIIIKDSIFDAHFTFDYSDANEYKESSARGTTDAIIFSRSDSNCIIENNYIKNWGHGSILIQALGEYEINNFKINNNFMTSPDIAYGGRFTVYGNVHNMEIFNNDFYKLSTQNQFGGYENYVHHNIINTVISSKLKETVNIGVGIAASGHGNIYENNVIANTDSECFKIMGAETYDNIFRNNILYNCGITMNGASIGLRPNDGGWMVPDSPTFQNNKFNNNIIYNNYNNKVIKHYFDGDMTLNVFERKYSSMPSKNNYYKNPRFIAENNFHLEKESPAINAGVPSLSNFDKDNNVIGDRLDIGAFIFTP